MELLPWEGDFLNAIGEREFLKTMGEREFLKTLGILLLAGSRRVAISIFITSVNNSRVNFILLAKIAVWQDVTFLINMYFTS